MWWSNAWNAFHSAPLIWVGPVMMVVFLLACIAVIDLMLRNRRRVGEDISRRAPAHEGD